MRVCSSKKCSREVLGRGKYCSRLCANRNVSRETGRKISESKLGVPLGLRAKRVSHVCPQCNTEFLDREKANRKFCSRSCSSKSQPVNPKVLEAFKKQWGIPRTKESYMRQRLKQSGPNHYNWRGGVTSENRRLRRSMEYREWRTSVFERDNYTCQECGSTKGGTFQAHHLKSFALYPELRFYLDNGVTLCRDCHKQTEGYGVPVRTVCAT